MEYKNIDTEIGELMKLATAKSKENKYSEAVEILKVALSKISKSALLYGHASYTKIIPYFQKAGRYQEAEKFCIQYIIPATAEAIKNGMSQRCKQIQDLHSLQHKSAIYEKLFLIAKREQNTDDQKQFAAKKLEIEQAILTARPLAEEQERQKEIKEMQSVFGANTNSWPEVIRKKLSV